MITYNQEKFVEQAVESVMMQKTNFNYLLIIGEDYSSDGTLGLCKILQQKYPGRLLLLANEKNLGVQANALQVYKACYASGAKYVAMIEGDDYWCDENKLQRQVDFLEANAQYAICFHETMADRHDGKQRMLGLNEDKSFELGDLIRRNFIPTVSAVFRVFDSLGQLDERFTKVFAGDWAMHLMNAMQGKIYYQKDIMAVYRIHPGGIWSRMKPRAALRKYISLMDELNEFFDYKFDREFKEGQQIIRNDYELGISFLAPGNFSFFGRARRKIRRLLGVVIR
jgi:glycosyltransferase involved in cell wall biosynthesis